MNMISYQTFFSFLKSHGFRISTIETPKNPIITAEGPYGPVAQLNQHNELALFEYDHWGKMRKIIYHLDEPRYQFIDYCDEDEVVTKREYVTDGVVVTTIFFDPDGVIVEVIEK
jgi:hypothetical protein